MNFDELQNNASPYLPPFNVGDAEVCLLEPTVVRVVVKVPWPKEHQPNDSEKTTVMHQTESIVRYIAAEGFVKVNSGLGIMVMTKHPDQL